MSSSSISIEHDTAIVSIYELLVSSIFQYIPVYSMPLVPLPFPHWAKNKSLTPPQYCRLKEVVAKAIEERHVMSENFEGYVVSAVSANARQAVHQVAAKYKWAHISVGKGDSRVVELRPSSAGTEGVIGTDGNARRTRAHCSEAQDVGGKRLRIGKGKGVGGTPPAKQQTMNHTPEEQPPRWRRLIPRISISSTSSSGEPDVDENTPFSPGDDGDVPISFARFFSRIEG